LDEISTHGRIVVKKAYGDWKNPVLKNWEDELKRLAIKPEQQFAYTSGKNATDISMVIGAMDLLYTGTYDAIVLISSDSDFTPLAIRLRESGVYVFGAGEEKTPQSFKNSCDDFILTEYLQDIHIGNENEAKEPGDTNTSAPAKKSEDMHINDVHKLLKLAYEKYQDADGYVNIGAAGSYIKRVKPDFTPKSYGVTKLTDLLARYPKKYEVKKTTGKGSSSIITYKCI
jgi:hypothetical protein